MTPDSFPDSKIIDHSLDIDYYKPKAGSSVYDWTADM